MGFRIKRFKKHFFCLLFSVCLFIKLVENMIVRQHVSYVSLSRTLNSCISFLLTRITSAKMSANFRVQQLVNFISKYGLLVILDKY